VRIERQDERRGAALEGLPCDALEDLLVAAVQPVEVAHGDHRLTPVGRAGIVGKRGGGKRARGHGDDHSEVRACPAEAGSASGKGGNLQAGWTSIVRPS
jgi:hypothetical protein